MLISESHKFIFVHIQRTGGMSMTKLLQQHVPDLRQIHGRHGHVRDAIPELGDSRRQYFIFAMVRNPWDRLVSWHAMIGQEFSRLPWRQRWFSSAPMRHANWNQARPYLDDFDGFVRHCTGIVWDEGCRKSFAFNQSDYLLDDTGNIDADYIGRFEDLEDDSARIFERIGLAGLRLPHENTSRHDHYSRYYNDETREIVGLRFQRDVERFGYRFEPVSLTRASAATARDTRSY